MQIVGDELERLALSYSDQIGADLLGRSAFNRYYYATFLITRETLGSMQSSWRSANHARIPTLLESELRKPAKSAIESQLKSGLLDKSRASQLLTDLNTAGSELAQLLRHAYDARVLADYEPEIKTVRSGNVITLSVYKLTTAKEWPDRANRLCARLLRTWKGVGLA